MYICVRRPDGFTYHEFRAQFVMFSIYLSESQSTHLFLLLARYVPNAAKRSIWEQCKKKYILRTDRRPMADRPLNFENFKRPYLRKASDPLHVWLYSGVFEVGGSNGTNTGFEQSKMAARPPSWKIQIAAADHPIYSVFSSRMGFSDREIEWRYFRFDQIQ